MSNLVVPGQASPHQVTEHVTNYRDSRVRHSPRWRLFATTWKEVANRLENCAAHPPTHHNAIGIPILAADGTRVAKPWCREQFIECPGFNSKQKAVKHIGPQSMSAFDLLAGWAADRRRRGRAHESREASPACPRSVAGRHRADGFTLIELMITVAVIAILAAIAVPIYTSYVPRSKITEATSSLSDMRNRMEQSFLDNRQFPVNCIPAAAGPAPAGSIYLPGGTQYFAVTCAFPSATTYTVTATGIAAKGMGSFAYTIDEANTRSTTSLPSGWSGAGSNCWVTKKDGSC